MRGGSSNRPHKVYEVVLLIPYPPPKKKRKCLLQLEQYTQACAFATDGHREHRRTEMSSFLVDRVVHSSYPLDKFWGLHADDRYADLLQKKLDKHSTKCFLINTGWTGGGYGVGKRMSIKATRACVNAVLDGSINKTKFTPDPVRKQEVNPGPDRGKKTFSSRPGTRQEIKQSTKVKKYTEIPFFVFVLYSFRF